MRVWSDVRTQRHKVFVVRWTEIHRAEIWHAYIGGDEVLLAREKIFMKQQEVCFMFSDADERIRALQHLSNASTQRTQNAGKS